MNKQPIHLIIRKIVWSFLLIVGLILLFLAVRSFSLPLPDGKNMAQGYMLLMFAACPLIICIGIFKWAFESELDKLSKRRELYKKHQGKELEEEVYSVDADIHHRSIKKRTRSVKQGLSVENCPKCGDKVDANENFCSKCGSSIYIKCNKCNTVNETTDVFCRNCGNKLKEQ